MTHVSNDAFPDLVVLRLHLRVVDVAALEIGDDLQSHGILVGVDEITRRLGADEASEAEDDSSEDLDRERQAPAPVGLDVRAGVIDPLAKLARSEEDRIRLTTDEEYPTMLPVNSRAPRNPRCSVSYCVLEAKNNSHDRRVRFRPGK